MPPDNYSDSFTVSKHHSLGNVFLVCLLPSGDSAEQAGEHFEEQRQAGGWGKDVDGLILAWPGAPDCDIASLRMALSNADGSMAEISGNGLCCLGQAAARAAGQQEFELDVETAAGRQRVVVKGGQNKTSQVSTTMGSPAIGDGKTVRRAAAAVSEISGQATFVDVGNPHLVARVDSLAGIDMGQVGALVNERFGDVNVECFTVGDGKIAGAGGAAVEMKVWERGVGVTEACGSGAVAVAKAAADWGLLRGSTENGGGTGSKVSVKMPGGVAKVTLSDPVLYETSVEFLG